VWQQKIQIYGLSLRVVLQEDYLIAGHDDVYRAQVLQSNKYSWAGVAKSFKWMTTGWITGIQFLVGAGIFLLSAHPNQFWAPHTCSVYQRLIGQVDSSSNTSDICGRWQFRILARMPAILAEVFCGIPESFQANSGYYLKLSHDAFFQILLNSLSTNQPTILHYMVWAMDNVIK
jgi:hypothetical protein